MRLKEKIPDFDASVNQALENWLFFTVNEHEIFA